MVKSQIITLIFLFLLNVFLMIAFVLNKEEDSTSKELSLCFVGDIIPHKSIVFEKKQSSRKLKKKFLYLLSYVSNKISSADIAFGNLEGPSASAHLKLNHRMAFNAPDEFLFALKKAGFDVLNIANNHAMDCKYEGFKQTIQKLHKFSFHVTGYTVNKNLHLAVLNKNDIKIGFIGLTSLINWSISEEGITNVGFFKNFDDSLDIIKKARKKVDYLIISIHWGDEYKMFYKQLKKWAGRIFKAGGDCIIGHHPHILLPIEYEKTRKGYKNIVTYSLGNFLANIGRKYKTFISSSKKGAVRRSIIFHLYLKRHRGKVYARDIGVTPVWIHNNYYEYINHKEKKRLIFPVIMDEHSLKFLSLKAKKFEMKEIYKSIKWDMTSSEP